MSDDENSWRIRHEVPRCLRQTKKTRRSALLTPAPWTNIRLKAICCSWTTWYPVSRLKSRLRSSLANPSLYMHRSRRGQDWAIQRSRVTLENSLKMTTTSLIRQSCQILMLCSEQRQSTKILWLVEWSWKRLSAKPRNANRGPMDIWHSLPRTDPKFVTFPLSCFSAHSHM